jgi:hypothetical protein
MFKTEFERELGQLFDLINQLFTAPSDNGGVALRPETGFAAQPAG